MKIKEQWKAIPACPEYSVSNHGKCKKGNTIVIPCMATGSKRLQLRIYDNSGIRHDFMLARLVYELFVGSLGQRRICYRDGDVSNCHVENLYPDRRAQYQGGRERAIPIVKDSDDIWLSMWAMEAPMITRLLLTQRTM